MVRLQTFEFAGVLTGDLIGSREHSPEALGRAMDALHAAAARQPGQPPMFERNRGDGWQLFLPDGRQALGAALRMIAALCASRASLATRIGIGLGPATIPPGGGLAAAGGAAFTSAGDMLDAMGRNERLRLPEDLTGPEFGAIAMLLDFESRRWNATQAEALLEALDDPAPTQDDIAARLGLSRQAVQSRLAGTALPAIQGALAAFHGGIEKAASYDRRPS